MSSNMLRAFLLAAGVATLSACVSMDYGPMSDERPYGYSETKREDGSYILRVVHLDAALAMKFWDQRATELCGHTGYAKNIYVASRPTVHYAYYGGMPGAPTLEGMLTCAPPTTTTAAAS